MATLNDFRKGLRQGLGYDDDSDYDSKDTGTDITSFGEALRTALENLPQEAAPKPSRTPIEPESVNMFSETLRQLPSAMKEAGPRLTKMLGGPGLIPRASDKIRQLVTGAKESIPESEDTGLFGDIFGQDAGRTVKGSLKGLTEFAYGGVIGVADIVNTIEKANRGELLTEQEMELLNSTPKEVLGKLGMAALEAGTSGLAGIGAKTLGKSGVSKTLKQATTKESLKEASKIGGALGAGFGLTGAMSDDADIRGIAANTALGGALGVGLGAAGVGLAKGAEALLGNIAKRRGDITAKEGLDIVTPSVSKEATVIAKPSGEVSVTPKPTKPESITTEPPVPQPTDVIAPEPPVKPIEPPAVVEKPKPISKPKGITTEVSEDIKLPDTYKENALRRFGTEKLTKSQFRSLANEIDEPIITKSEKIIDKVANINKGVDYDVFRDRPSVLGTVGKYGVFTDSYMAIIDKKAARDVFNGYVERMAKKEAKETAKAGANEKKSYKEWVKFFEKQSNSDNPPDVEKIIPKDIGDPLSIFGYRKGNLILDGKDGLVAVNADKFAFMRKHLPNDKISTSGKYQPVVFSRNGKITGLLMPLGYDSKDILGEYASRYTGEYTKRSSKTAKKTTKSSKSDKSLIVPPKSDADGNVTDDLINEARKYKSAAEFVRAQPIKIYHSTNQANKDIILRDGFKKGSDLPENAFRGGGYGEMQDSISFADNVKDASRFGISQKNTLIEAELKPNAKIIKRTDIEYAEELNDEIPRLLKEGIDAVRLPNAGEGEIVVINKKAIQKITDTFDYKGVEAKDLDKLYKSKSLTKSQLTDIWNKANKQTITKPTRKPTMDAEVIPAKSKPEDIPNVKTARTPEELKTMIDDTRKISKGMGVNVFNDMNSSKYLGFYEHLTRKYQFGRIKINQNIANEIRAETIAHETAHAIDSYISGGKKAGKTSGNFKVLFNASDNELQAIKDELKNVTLKLVGDSVISKNPSYYYNNKELYARFLQSVMYHPDIIEDYAPLAMKKLADMAIKEPVISDFLTVAKKGMLEKPVTFFFMPDARQQYIKELGNYLGSKAWGEEVLYRARRQKAISDTEVMIKKLFKGVKDDTEKLFEAAEGIKSNINGRIEFGTRIYKTMDGEQKVNVSDIEREYKTLVAAGYEFIGKDGAGRYIFSKWRVAPEQARLAYETLSKEGKKLIDEYTRDVSEASTVFNREKMKRIYNIEANIEGYVHHFFDDKGTAFFKTPMLKEKKAAARKLREEADGYVKDFKKATQKALTDLAVEKEYNKFINKQIALVAEPLAQGEKVRSGWVEIAGNNLRGFKSPQDARIMVPKEGTDEFISVLAGKRYQVPRVVYDRYVKEVQLGEDMSAATRIINTLNRYWTGNILIHAGSTGTNFISGGLQYGSKVMTDFYKDILTGSVSMPRTRADMITMFETLTPNGWRQAPTWIYGGNKSNFYQQFIDAPGANKAIDEFIDKGLTGYQAVENYWKKVIVNAEKKIQKPVSVDDEAFIKSVNDAVDLFAFDYDNIPTQLLSWKRSPLGTLTKPFVTYPYKYAKAISNLAGAAFDPNQPVVDRMAKVMALGTIITAYGLASNALNKIAITNKVDESIAEDVDQDKLKSVVNARGRLYIGKDKNGNEVYVRTAKYPFLNITDLLKNVGSKNWQGVQDILQDQLGTVGPIARYGLAVMGYNSTFDKYKTKDVIAAESAASYIPAGRVLRGVAEYLDPSPYKRDFPKTPKEVFGLYLPTTNANLKNKISPKEQTARIPLKPGQRAGSRTTEDVKIPKYKEDLLWSELGGIYLKRINPEWYNRYIQRQVENSKKNK